MALYNLAGFKTATLGTADVVFSAPITALNTFPLAGVPNGATVTYMLENFDGTGSVDAREVGRGVWNSGTLTLARTTVNDSTNGGAKIVLGGNAEARITAIAQDFSAAAVGAPALVTPSVVGNFVSFSNVSGGQADSGFSGASFQPIDATLTSIAALGTAANKMIYTTALDTWAEADLSPFARTILDDANAAAVRTTIGAGTGSGDISGTGVVGQVAEFVTNTKTIQAANLIAPTGAILTLINANAKSITFPGSTNDTVALLATANAFSAVQTIAINDAVTNTFTDILKIDHTTSGTATTSFGAQILFRLESSTGNLRDAGSVLVDWNTATDASRVGRLKLGVDNNSVMQYVLEMTKSGITLNPQGASNGDLLLSVADSGTTYFRVTKNSTNGHMTVFQTASSDKPGLVISGGSGATGTLQEWRFTGGTVLGSISSVGFTLHNPITTTTNAVFEAMRLQVNVSTAATGSANGFGTGLSWFAETATNDTNQQQGLISTSWIDATNASRKAVMKLAVFDTASREGIAIEASGSAVKLGFFGHATSLQSAAYTPTNVTTDRSYDANSTSIDEIADVVGTLISDLQSLGLVA